MIRSEANQTLYLIRGLRIRTQYVHIQGVLGQPKMGTERTLLVPRSSKSSFLGMERLYRPSKPPVTYQKATPLIEGWRITDSTAGPASDSLPPATASDISGFLFSAISGLHDRQPGFDKSPTSSTSSAKAFQLS